jgi:hypothetical protein
VDNPLLLFGLCWLAPMVVAGFIGFAIGRGYRIKIDRL